MDFINQSKLHLSVWESADTVPLRIWHHVTAAESPLTLEGGGGSFASSLTWVGGGLRGWKWPAAWLCSLDGTFGQQMVTSSLLTINGASIHSYTQEVMWQKDSNDHLHSALCLWRPQQWTPPALSVLVCLAFMPTLRWVRGAFCQSDGVKVFLVLLKLFGATGTGNW